MPVNLPASDRRLVLWGVAVVVILIVALAVRSAEQQEALQQPEYER